MPASNSSARFLFNILELLGRSETALALRDVRTALDLPTATAHRGLATLEASGFVARHRESSRYVLGPAAGRLRQAFFARFLLHDHALPHLRRLSVTSGATASIHVRLGWYLVRIAAVRGPDDIVNRGAASRIRRLDDGLAARVILGCLPHEEQQRFRRYCAKRGPGMIDRPPPTFETDFTATESLSGTPARITIATVLRDNHAAPAASVSLDAVAAQAPDTEWRAVLCDLQRALVPVLNHYAHLDPDLIDLELGASAAGTG